jgi:hypothetical protein
MERPSEGDVSQSYSWVFVFILDLLPVVAHLELLCVFWYSKAHNQQLKEI